MKAVIAIVMLLWSSIVHAAQTETFSQYLITRPLASQPAAATDSTVVIQRGIAKQVPISGLGLQSALTFTPEDTARRGQPGGYAALDSAGNVVGTNIPPASYFVGNATGGFANLSTAKSVLGTTRATVTFTADQTVNTLTIPANIELMPLNGAIITVNGGKTFTYLGSTARWPTAQIFKGGTVAGLQEAKPEYFGAKGDGITDDLPAFNTTIASLGKPGATFLNAGMIQLARNTTYFLSGTLAINSCVHFIGHSTGQQGSPSSTVLKFPADTAGVVINKVYGSASGGDGSIFDGIFFQGGGGTNTAAYGIYMKARAVVRNSTVTGFAGHNIYIYGDSAALHTNANGWRLDTVTLSGSTAGDGLHVEGSDANAGTGIALDLQGNYGYGIYDASFLGNTYVGAQAASNALGPYKTLGSVNTTTLDNCYIEGGQPDPSYAGATVVLGGQGQKPSFGGVFLGKMQYNVLSATPGPGLTSFGVNTSNSTPGTDATVFLGSAGSASNAVMGMFSNDGGGMVLKKGTGQYYWDWNEHEVPIMQYLDPSYTGRTLTAGTVAFPRGFMVANNSIWSFANAMPTGTTAHNKGDIVWNTDPSQSGHVTFWQAITTGTSNVLNTDWIAK